jgi:hypothetical protein
MWAMITILWNLVQKENIFDIATTN